MSASRRLQIDPYISHCTKLKYKLIKDFNIKPDILNLIGEKVGDNLECPSTGHSLLNIILIVQVLRLTINKWNLVELKSFCKAKDTANKTKQQLTEWENISPTLHMLEG